MSILVGTAAFVLVIICAGLWMAEGFNKPQRRIRRRGGRLQSPSYHRRGEHAAKDMSHDDDVVQEQLRRLHERRRAPNVDNGQRRRLGE